MQEWTALALDTAKTRGASFADARVVDLRLRDLSTKNGEVGTLAESESLGLGIRALANGCWGFASSDMLTREGVQACAAQAVAIARASAMAKRADAEMVPEKAYVDTWQNPYVKDPFQIPLERQLDLLLAADYAMRRVKGLTLAETSMQFRRLEQWYASTLGSRIHQLKMQSGAGIVATSFVNDEIQKRSYPNSFGGQHQLAGYELVEALDLPGNAQRVAEEALALHKAAQCPEGERTVILDSSQLGLQIHESVGHPIELDRVLGSEANYAGMSFLTLDKLGKLRYGSDLVNVVCDARLEHGPGLGTFAFDDEGVPAQQTDIIRSGLFTGYMTSRETASAIGERRSNGTMRADGWARIPLIRMTNVSLKPGAQSLEEVFGGSGHAIYMETNKSWSIDDKRYNFQFGCEIAWEIRHGKRVRMLKNPSYSGISTEFWNACD